MRQASGQVLRVLRRSTALALAAVSVWVTVRTADLPDMGTAVRSLSQDASFAIALLSTQLSAPPQDGLNGWQRLALAQSPLLHSARDSAPALLWTGGHPTSPATPDPEDEDLSEPILTEPDADAPGVIARTMVPSSSQAYLHTGDIYIANRAEKQADVAALATAPVHISLSSGPQILILHSHGSEAYTPYGSDVYTESDPFRTTDCNYNVVRVGEEIARVLRDHGFEVIHDTTLYDYPSYSEAYDRSLAAAQRWLTQHPSIQVVLDVHRDALAAEDGTIYKAVSSENGEQAAQVMLVVGTDGTKKHPLWQENLTFAMRVQQQLLDDHDTLARPMVLRASRYNQHLSVGSILVEVGTHGNTLQEALLGARLFAQSTAKTLLSLKK